MDINLAKIIFYRFWKPFLLFYLLGIILFTIQKIESSLFPIFSNSIELRFSLEFLYYNLSPVTTNVFPGSFFIATLIVYSRLPYDSLIPRLGITNFLKSLFLPLLSFAILISLLFYIHNDKIVPEYNHKQKIYATEFQYRQSHPNEKRKPEFDPFISRSDREMNLRMLQTSIDSLLILKEKMAQNIMYPYLEKIYSNDINLYKLEIQKMYAISLEPILFAFLGAIIGYLINRRSIYNIAGLGLTIYSFFLIVLFFSYKYCANISLSPYGIWFPNIMILVICFILSILLARKLRRQSLIAEKVYA